MVKQTILMRSNLYFVIVKFGMINNIILLQVVYILLYLAAHIILLKCSYFIILLYCMHIMDIVLTVPAVGIVHLSFGILLL